MDLYRKGSGVGHIERFGCGVSGRSVGVLRQRHD